MKVEITEKVQPRQFTLVMDLSERQLVKLESILIAVLAGNLPAKYNPSQSEREVLDPIVLAVSEFPDVGA